MLQNIKTSNLTSIHAFFYCTFPFSCQQHNRKTARFRGRLPFVGSHVLQGEGVGTNARIMRGVTESGAVCERRAVTVFLDEAAGLGNEMK
jgi:hypothetical protein